MALESIQVRLSPKYMKLLDLDVKKGKYPNRSEAFRWIVKEHYDKNSRRAGRERDV